MTRRLRPSAGALLFALFVLFVPDHSLAVEPRLNTRLGEAFPDMAFDELLAAEDYVSLGLPQRSGPFRLSEVPGDLLVLEFFNRYCITCQRQAPYLTSFFEATGSDDLEGRVRLLAVGVGNRLKDLEAFRRDFKASYPLAADPRFDRLMELGDPGGTPFTVFLVRRDGAWVLADYQMGLEGDTELLARTGVILKGGGGQVRASAVSEDDTRHPPLDLSPEEQERRAQALLSRVAGTPVTVAARTLADGSRLFEALGADGKPLGLFAHIGSRDPVCDVCHAIHFFFAFDTNGVVRGFEPIHVTKYGNALWTTGDSAHMEQILRGKRMADLRFDPEVDAVTRATMSSALIFDEIRRTADLLAQLKRN